MRFICLHGAGTNSHVLDIQTGPIRQALGSSEKFEFVNGFLDVEPVAQIKNLFAGPFFTWYSPGFGGHTLEEAKADLMDFIETEGPFDACLGFSQGGSLLASIIMDHQRRNPFGPNLFKLAVFLCSGAPLLVPKSRQLPDVSTDLWLIAELESLTEPWLGPYVPGHEPMLDESWNVFIPDKVNKAGLTINIPTAHIYGSKDETLGLSLRLRDMCDPRWRVELDHGGWTRRAQGATYRSDDDGSYSTSN
ncbi:Serine hydrolase FSH [Penicillium expansum]|nr:Serine hydrolase FSH [Penicillium expansum]